MLTIEVSLKSEMRSVTAVTQVKKRFLTYFWGILPFPGPGFLHLNFYTSDAIFRFANRLTKARSRSTIGDSVPTKGKDLPVTSLLTTNLGATPLLGRGKVRDLYAIGH